MSVPIVMLVILAMGLRCSSGLDNWSTLSFAPTAAAAGMEAQMMHMVSLLGVRLYHPLLSPTNGCRPLEFVGVKISLRL